MTFAHPPLLWLLAVLPLLLVLFGQGERRRRRLLTRADPLGTGSREARRPILAHNASLAKRRLRFALLLLGLAAVLVALAQPRYGYRMEERKTFGRDLLIAIDTSRSMLANDLQPSRLARAKLAAEDLIGQLHGDRVGLIAFAGSAFLQAPLTADYSAVLDSVRALDTQIIFRGGTDLAQAIRTAADAFGPGESEHRALVLMTDGEELDEDGVAAAKAASASMRIFTVGLGSAQGTIIALAGADGRTEYLKSPEGEIVKSRLDENRLQEIAKVGGGFYLHLQNGHPEMEALARQGLDPMSQHESTGELARQPIERYQWPLATGLVLLAASLLPGERRRLRAASPVAAAALLLLFAAPAWGTNPGLEAYEKKDYTGALSAFEKQLQQRPDFDALQFDTAAAAYQAGDLEKALDGFSKALTSPRPELHQKAEYSLGNTLFRRGAAQPEKPAKIEDWKSALQHYEEALKATPGDENAKYNHELLTKLLAELQKEPPKQEKQDSQKKEQQKKKDEKKQDGQQPKKEEGQQDSSPQDSTGQKGQSGQGTEQSKPKPGEQGDQSDPQPGQKDEPKEPKDAGEPKPSPGEPREAKEEKGQEQPETPADQPPEQQPRTGKLADAKPQKGEPQDPAKTAEQQQAEAAEEAQAAAEGKMTAHQAATLLESLKSEDRRVDLLNPGKKKRELGVGRDW